jgi:hypothetical protein
MKMAEIQKALKYEEKFAFGLTAKQLVYILTSIILSVFVYTKMPLLLEYKLVVISSLLFLGFLAAFADLDRKLVEMGKYLAWPRDIGYLDHRMLKIMGIVDIKDDIVWFKDRAIAVLRVAPINLAIKSDEERAAIKTAFRRFLNSLDFDIQLSIRTVDSLHDLREYFESFERFIKKKNVQVNAAFLEHRRFFEEFVRSNSIKNRLFYIIIPCRLQKKKTRKEIAGQLGTRVGVVREKLAACGIKTGRLSTRKLISLLASYFEEFVEVNQEYLFPISIASEWLKKRKLGGRK